MTTIGSTYHFESAHRLPLLPDSHKCHNLHGHNYKLVVTVRGELDARGFVMDFAELDAVLMPLIKQVDHTYLNDIPGLENPTAEIIAKWFFDQIPGVASVRVYETEEYFAEVSK